LKYTKYSCGLLPCSDENDLRNPPLPQWCDAARSNPQFLPNRAMQPVCFLLSVYEGLGKKSTRFLSRKRVKFAQHQGSSLCLFFSLFAESFL
jgi:hypothetical protein